MLMFSPDSTIVFKPVNGDIFLPAYFSPVTQDSDLIWSVVVWAGIDREEFNNNKHIYPTGQYFCAPQAWLGAEQRA